MAEGKRFPKKTAALEKAWSCPRGREDADVSFARTSLVTDRRRDVPVLFLVALCSSPFSPPSSATFGGRSQRGSRGWGRVTWPRAGPRGSLTLTYFLSFFGFNKQKMVIIFIWIPAHRAAVCVAGSCSFQSKKKGPIFRKLLHHFSR